jgi:cytochrome c oxidase subunit 4
MREGDAAMTDVAMTTGEHAGVTLRLFLTIWVYLLIITAVELVLTYLQMFSTMLMLLILVFLSLGKAGMIVAYFMHLKFEKPALVWTLIPPALLVIALLFVFFPDGARALALRAR